MVVEKIKSRSASGEGRRKSTVGVIDLGDNAAPSLSTMPILPDQARASRRRQRALSGVSNLKTSNDETSKQPTESQLSLLERYWISYREISYNNTWLNPLLLMGVVLVIFYSSSDRSEKNPLHKFVQLSYAIPGTDPVLYGKGPKDLAFVTFGMVFFTFFREFWMQIILRPLAFSVGVTKRGKVKRFMEQTYSIVYYGMSGPLGLYIMYHSPLWYFNTEAFYVDYPHKTHQALFKAFYLLQASFWAQQSVVLMLQLEKPRKDFKELVFHHVITMALIFLSYRFHFTWMGLAVFITMDVCDFFLGVSKTLNYLNSPITSPFFIVFMFIWIYTRHYLNIKILISIVYEFPTIGDFTLNWATEQYKCWISQYITFALLFGLHLVNSYWLFLVFRIAYRVVFEGIEKDERSDDEDEEEFETYDSGDSPIDSKPGVPKIQVTSVKQD